MPLLRWVLWVEDENLFATFAVAFLRFAQAVFTNGRGRVANGNNETRYAS